MTTKQVTLLAKTIGELNLDPSQKTYIARQLAGTLYLFANNFSPKDFVDKVISYYPD